MKNGKKGEEHNKKMKSKTTKSKSTQTSVQEKNLNRIVLTLYKQLS